MGDGPFNPRPPRVALLSGCGDLSRPCPLQRFVLGAPQSFEAGVCIGILQTLGYMQPLLDPKYGKAGYCLPQGLPYAQEVRIVVTYLQSHPERLREEGSTLALDALHQAFPCKQ